MTSKKSESQEVPQTGIEPATFRKSHVIGSITLLTIQPKDPYEKKQQVKRYSRDGKRRTRGGQRDCAMRIMTSGSDAADNIGDATRTPYKHPNRDRMCFGDIKAKSQKTHGSVNRANHTHFRWNLTLIMMVVSVCRCEKRLRRYGLQTSLN